MLEREELPIVYVYRYANITPEKGKFDVLESEEKLEDDQYVLMFTKRKAFIGDMQEKLDAAMGCSNLLRFCNSKKNCNDELIVLTKTNTIYIPCLSLFERLKSWILRKKKKEDDTFLEDQLFGNNPQSKNVEEYLL